MKKLSENDLLEEKTYRKQMKFKEYGKVNGENTLEWIINKQIELKNKKRNIK